jgi:hypothetical protein
MKAAAEIERCSHPYKSSEGGLFILFLSSLQFFGCQVLGNFLKNI